MERLPYFDEREDEDPLDGAFSAPARLLESTSADLMADERGSDSPFVERIWRSYGEREMAFVSVAETHWSLVVSKYRDRTTLTIRGPETRPTAAYGPADVEFFGVQFRHGTLMPLFPAQLVMDRADVNLPVTAGQKFWLNGAAWEFPDFDNVEMFVQRLVRSELLIRDPLVTAALQGQVPDSSLRTVQRRFLQATGMTHNTLYQIERARKATLLLKSGSSILDTVDQLGYADQPHLTRALKRWMGITPAVLVSARRDPLSFLFKTENP